MLPTPCTGVPSIRITTCSICTRPLPVRHLNTSPALWRRPPEVFGQELLFSEPVRVSGMQLIWITLSWICRSFGRSAMHWALPLGRSDTNMCVPSTRTSATSPGRQASFSRKSSRMYSAWTPRTRRLAPMSVAAPLGGPIASSTLTMWLFSTVTRPGDGWLQWTPSWSYRPAPPCFTSSQPRSLDCWPTTSPADSGTRRNGLSEADLDVPAKLFEEGLQRHEEAEALPRRQVVAEHDLLQLGVTERVEVEVPRQVATQPAVRVLHGPLLPGGVGVAEPGRHRAGPGEQAVPGEGGVVVEGDRGAQPRVEPPEDRHHDRHGLGRRLAGQPGREHEAGLALLEHQHRPGPLADQEVTFPVPGVLARLDGLGPVVDRAPPGDGGARRPGPPPAAPGPPARQQLPELLALLPRAVDEGVDRLGRHSTEPALLAPLEPAGDLLRRPAFQQALAHEPAEPLVALQDRGPLPALAVAALGVHRQVAAPRQRVAPQLAADRRGRPAERPGDRPQAEPLGLQRGQPLPFLQLQMRSARHRPIPDRRSRPGPYHKAPGCCPSRRTPPQRIAGVDAVPRPRAGAGRGGGRAGLPPAGA